ncbi:heparan-alpha-glucosaminide N-acetyltransferase [Artemisia annua]|uniref:Heparan-alpha-glucosaminide N-acetyltransferase n=1 Tax=Artemisia annua TaxID=35608 RepID=A0A2U1N932_ARTAN|nr:heparan-alpha-glucosaminide N-acetyltransferase [Artemisia annua]
MGCGYLLWLNGSGTNVSKRVSQQRSANVRNVPRRASIHLRYSRLMILVDDAGGEWPVIGHAPWNGCSLADFLMPSFLLIVGMAIALALKIMKYCGQISMNQDAVDLIEKSETSRMYSMFKLMILVDDAGGEWPVIGHAPWNGCSLADFLMPSFLLIVGMAIALALKIMKYCGQISMNQDAVDLIEKIYDNETIGVERRLFINCHRGDSEIEAALKREHPGFAFGCISLKQAGCIRCLRCLEYDGAGYICDIVALLDSGLFGIPMVGLIYVPFLKTRLKNFASDGFRTLNRLQHLVVEEVENCYVIAHMERESGVSPRRSPLAHLMPEITLICRYEFLISIKKEEDIEFTLEFSWDTMKGKSENVQDFFPSLQGAVAAVECAGGAFKGTKVIGAEVAYLIVDVKSDVVVKSYCHILTLTSAATGRLLFNIVKPRKEGEKDTRSAIIRSELYTSQFNFVTRGGHGWPGWIMARKMIGAEENCDTLKGQFELEELRTDFNKLNKEVAKFRIVF